MNFPTYMKGVGLVWPTERRSVAASGRYIDAVHAYQRGQRPGSPRPNDFAAALSARERIRFNQEVANFHWIDDLLHGARSPRLPR